MHACTIIINDVVGMHAYAIFSNETVGMKTCMHVQNIINEAVSIHKQIVASLHKQQKTHKFSILIIKNCPLSS